MEQKLKDKGFRGPIDYKKITPESSDDKKKDLTDLETNNLTVGTSIDDFHSGTKNNYSFFNNEIVKLIAKSTTRTPEVSLFMGLPSDFKNKASFINRKYAYGNLLDLVSRISKTHWDPKSGRNYYIAFSDRGAIYKVIYAGSDKLNAKNIWKNAIKNNNLNNTAG